MPKPFALHHPACIRPLRHGHLPLLCRTLLAAALLLIGMAGAHAQKRVLVENKETALVHAREALAAAMAPGGPLHQTVVKENLIGRYLLQVSFREKGTIVNVFVAEANDGDIRSQNRFKQLVHGYRLPFSIPKGKQYRIEQEFNLNAINHHAP